MTSLFSLAMTPLFSLAIAMRTVSEANQREHWSARARRVSAQRQTIGRALASHGEHLVALRAAPCIVVELTRVAPRALDSDNAVGAMKAVRDAIAAWIGIDDGSSRYEWRYAQRRGPASVMIAFAITIRKGLVIPPPTRRDGP